MEPIFEGTYEECHRQAIEYYGWKVGDRVKVINSFKDDRLSFVAGGSVSDVGKTFKIESFKPNVSGSPCVRLTSGYMHPYYCLEPAE